MVGEWIFSGTTHFATLLYLKLDAKNLYPIPDSPSVNPKFPDKCDPILDQNLLISIPYPRLNWLKTIRFRASQIHIAHIMGVLPQNIPKVCCSFSFLRTTARLHKYAGALSGWQQSSVSVNASTRKKEIINTVFLSVKTKLY